MRQFFEEFLTVNSVANGFWVFVGIVAGALIQYFLGFLQGRRQAKNAFKVLKIEIQYNLAEVTRFREHVAWLKSRIQAQQISEEDLFFPMQRFDYSTIGPLANSGYFHILLGPENVRKYLEFNHFFRIDNGQNLAAMLRTEHSAGKSMAFLEWVETRADEVTDGLRSIENARLAPIRMKLVGARK